MVMQCFARSQLMWPTCRHRLQGLNMHTGENIPVGSFILTVQLELKLCEHNDQDPAVACLMRLLTLQHEPQSPSVQACMAACSGRSQRRARP
jgi:hypothetical protein